MDQRTFVFLFLVLFYCQRLNGEPAKYPIEPTANDECTCSSKLSDRISKLEIKDTRKEEDITILKTTVHQLKGQVALLEAGAEELTLDDTVTNKVKRPARLLPYNFLRYSR